MSHGKYSPEKELAKRGFHIFLLTNRGFGRSTHVTEDHGDRWYEVFADDAIAFCNGMGINRFVYSGASHGAGTGWHVALKYPERLICFFALVAGPHNLDEGHMSIRTMQQKGIAPPQHVFRFTTDDERILERQRQEDEAKRALLAQPDYEEIYNSPETRALDYGRPLRAYQTEANLQEALLTGKYNIDKSRIYMQGMSNGDMMPLAFSMRHPELPAAAGYATGPSAEEAIAGDSPRGSLPIIQMRGELDVYWHLPDDVADVYATRYGMNDRNRELWETANGTAGKLPEVAIRGMDNFLIYHGDRAPLISWEIRNCGHRDPVNVAEVFWKRLYSGARLADGEHVYDAPDMPVTGDENTVILATGSRYAYKKDRMILMSDQPKATARTFTPIVPRPGTFKLGEMAETEYTAAPADFFASIYGAKVEYNAMGDGVALTLADGRVVELMNQSILVKADGEFRTVQKPCVLLSGVLFVPVGELCQMLFDAHVAVAEDVMCISDHHAVLGRYTASILRKLMGGVMRPRTRPEEW